jgi:cyclase
MSTWQEQKKSFLERKDKLDDLFSPQNNDKRINRANANMGQYISKAGISTGDFNTDPGQIAKNMLATMQSGIEQYINLNKDISAVIKCGIEKVCINSYLSQDINLLSKCADKFGSSATVASIDVKKDFWGKYRVVVRNGEKQISKTPVEFAIEVAAKGAGEIMLNAVDRDGVMNGFDLQLINEISKVVDIPVIACGGAGTIQHLKEGIEAGASAVAAGSMFVFQGKHRAVLISYPSQDELKLVDGKVPL